MTGCRTRRARPHARTPCTRGGPGGGAVKTGAPVRVAAMPATLLLLCMALRPAPAATPRTCLPPSAPPPVRTRTGSPSSRRPRWTGAARRARPPRPPARGGAPRRCRRSSAPGRSAAAAPAAARRWSSRAGRGATLLLTPPMTLRRRALPLLRSRDETSAVCGLESAPPQAMPRSASTRPQRQRPGPLGARHCGAGLAALFAAAAAAEQNTSGASNAAARSTLSGACASRSRTGCYHGAAREGDAATRDPGGCRHCNSWLKNYRPSPSGLCGHWPVSPVPCGEEVARRPARDEDYVCPCPFAGTGFPYQCPRSLR